MRAINAAVLTGSSLLVEAVTMTASAPRPSVNASAASTRPELQTASAPSARASSPFDAIGSKPSTLHPLALSN